MTSSCLWQLCLGISRFLRKNVYCVMMLDMDRPYAQSVLPTSYQIGSLTIAPNVVLAPMAGVTDTVFRRLILGLGGCGLVCSEMTNAASVSPKALRRHKLLDYVPEERPLAMQISGNDPELVARAANIVEQLGADVLDINCGCPSPKVTGGGHGASLLCNLPRLRLVLRAVRRAVSLPITLKYRAGWDDTCLNYVETARIAEEEGIDALTLHPRTREQRYSGEADWSRVAEVKQQVNIPVVGSGDICDAWDALRRMQESGVDGVMIGRAALANPWIFRQVEQLRRGEPVFEPALDDRYHLLMQFISMYGGEVPERIALNKLKQFVTSFISGMPWCAALRAQVHRSSSIAEARTLLDTFFAGYGVDIGVGTDASGNGSM